MVIINYNYMSFLFNLINSFTKIAAEQYTEDELAVYKTIYKNSLLKMTDETVFYFNNLPTRMADLVSNNVKLSLVFEKLVAYIYNTLSNKSAIIDKKDYKIIVNGKNIYSIYQLLNKEINDYKQTIDGQLFINRAFVDFDKLSEQEYLKTKNKLLETGRDFKINKLTKDGFFNEFIHSFGSIWLSIVKDELNALNIESSEDYSAYTGKNVTNQYDEIENWSHSCMTGDKSIYTELYAKNPDKVKLIVYKSLRFLLWKADDGTVIVDRIYPNNHSLISTIHRWAMKNGFIYRKSQEAGDIWLSDNSKRKITVNIKDLEAFPYLDTFRYFDYENMAKGFIELRNYRNSKNDCELTADDGEYFYNGKWHSLQEPEPKEYCIRCGVEVDDDDTANIDGKIYCSNCYFTHFFTCESCQEVYDRKFALKANEDDEDELYCEYCFKDFVKCPGCNKLDKKRNMVLVGLNYKNILSNEEDKAAKSYYCKTCAKTKNDELKKNKLNFRTCYSCYKDYYSDDVRYVVNANEFDEPYDFICKQCLEDNDEDDVFACKNCNSIFITDDIFNKEYCPKCFEMKYKLNNNLFLPGFDDL